jgi:hypothetical protein
LFKDLQITEHTLAKRVSRTREALRQQFLEFTGYLIDDHDVIESATWKGFRLRPYLMSVSASELKQDGDVITRAPDVRTRAAGVGNAAKFRSKMS